MTDDDLTDFDRSLLPTAVRVTIPIADLPTTAYHDISTKLRELAMRYEELYYGRDRTQRERRLSASFCLEEFRAAVKRIAKLHGIEIREGRPKNSERAEREANSSATEGVAFFRKPQQFGGAGRG